MRDIYLIDFENVASEGLSGITYLSPEDQVIIFYSANSNRLTMKMHILIGKSKCTLSYFEVSVGGKNALDHQIATWLGYLIGTEAAEGSYYIVSRDMGYRHVASFWAVNDGKPKVRCVDSIRAAVRMGRMAQVKRAEAEKTEPAPEPEPKAAEPEAEPSEPVTTEPETAEPMEPQTEAEPVWEPETAGTVLAQEELTDSPEAPQPEPEAEPETKPEPEPEPPAQESGIFAVLAGDPEPLESLEEPEPKPEPQRRSYRGRTKFRRGRPAKNRGNDHGQEKPAVSPEPVPEQPKAAAEPEQKTPAAEPAAPVVEQTAPAAELPAPVAEQKAPEAEPKTPELEQKDPAAELKKPERRGRNSGGKGERRSSGRWQKSRGGRAYGEGKAPAEGTAEKPDAQEVQGESEKKPELPEPPAREPMPAAKAAPRETAEAAPVETAKPQEGAKAEPEPKRRKPRAARGEGKTRQGKPQESHNLEVLPGLLAPYPELQESAIRELVLANKRQVLCNKLRKELGQEKGLALYNELKKSAWK